MEELAVRGEQLNVYLDLAPTTTTTFHDKFWQTGVGLLPVLVEGCGYLLSRCLILLVISEDPPCLSAMLS